MVKLQLVSDGRALSRPFSVKMGRHRYYVSHTGAVCFMFDVPPVHHVPIEVHVESNGTLIRRSRFAEPFRAGVWQRPSETETFSAALSLSPFNEDEKLQSVSILDDGGDDGGGGDDGTGDSDTVYQTTVDAPNGTTELTNNDGQTCSVDQWNRQIDATAEALGSLGEVEEAAAKVFAIVALTVGGTTIAVGAAVLAAAAAVSKALIVWVKSQKSSRSDAAAASGYQPTSLVVITYQSSPPLTRSNFKILVTNQVSDYNGYMGTLNGVAAICANYYPDFTVLGTKTTNPPSYQITIGGSLWSATTDELAAMGLGAAPVQWLPTGFYEGFLVVPLDGTLLQDPTNGSYYVYYGGASWAIPDPERTIPILGLDIISAVTVPASSAPWITWPVARVGTLVREVNSPTPWVCVSADHSGDPGVVHASNGYFRNVTDAREWDWLGGPSATSVVPDGALSAI